MGTMNKYVDLYIESENIAFITLNNKPVNALSEELIENLQKQIKELEGAKAESKERHTKRREHLKNPTKPNKQKVGFLKKHKPKK